MLKLFEVFEVFEVKEEGKECLARIDVTENTESERTDILANLKTYYGSGCQYIDHDCGHDQGRPCDTKSA